MYRMRKYNYLISRSHKTTKLRHSSNRQSYIELSENQKTDVHANASVDSIQLLKDSPHTNQRIQQLWLVEFKIQENQLFYIQNSPQDISFSHHLHHSDSFYSSSTSTLSPMSVISCAPSSHDSSGYNTSQLVTQSPTNYTVSPASIPSSITGMFLGAAREAER